MTPSGTWDGSNETNEKYKTWAADVYAWANQNNLTFLIKIARRIADGTLASFSPSVPKTSDLEEFLGNEDEPGVKVEDKVEVAESEKLVLPTTTRSGWTKPVDAISQDLQPEDFAVDEMLLLLDGATAPKSGRKQDNL